MKEGEKRRKKKKKLADYLQLINSEPGTGGGGVEFNKGILVIQIKDFPFTLKYIGRETRITSFGFKTTLKFFPNYPDKTPFFDFACHKPEKNKCCLQPVWYPMSAPALDRRENLYREKPGSNATQELESLRIVKSSYQKSIALALQRLG